MYPSEEDVLRERIRELAWVRNLIFDLWPLSSMWPLKSILALIERRVDVLEMKAYEFEKIRRGI